MLFMNASSKSSLLMILYLIVLFGILYFIVIRPTRKQQQEKQKMLDSIARGDEVVTIGGLHGTVDEITDSTVTLDCEGIYLTFERGAISTVIKAEDKGTGTDRTAADKSGTGKTGREAKEEEVEAVEVNEDTVATVDTDDDQDENQE